MPQKPKPESEQKNHFYTAPFKEPEFSNPTTPAGALILAKNKKMAVKKAKNFSMDYQYNKIHRAHAYDIINSNLTQEKIRRKKSNMYIFSY